MVLKKLVIRGVFLVLAVVSCQNLMGQLNGQIRNAETQKYAYQVIRDLTRPRVEEFKVDLDDVKGSPYLNDAYLPCRLLSKGEDKGVFLARYNIYSDEFELSSEEGVIALLKSPYVRLELDGSVFKVASVAEDEKVAQVYVEVLKEISGVSFFKRYKSTFTPFRKAVTPMETDQQAKFTTTTGYYLAREGESPVEVKLKRSDLLDYFDNDWVKAYVREHKSEIKTEAGVIALLEEFGEEGVQ